MYCKIINFLKNLILLQGMLFCLLSSPQLMAGNLDSPAAVNNDNSNMYTISDIYNRLDTGETATKADFTEPTSGPGSTGHTLNQVMDKTPAVNSDAATEAEITTGKKFWSLKDGNWGEKTGTMPDSSGDITPGDTQKTIPAGYHDGSRKVKTDSDLTEANIKDGTVIFGVTGTHTGIGGNIQDTSSGDAQQGDIAQGKNAWVDGQLIDGSVAAGNNISGNDGSKTITIPNALYSGNKTITANDTNLTADNIKCGITIFGITGTDGCEVSCNGIAASDSSVCSARGNCTAEDTCQCDAAYTGQFCEQLIPITCFGIANTDASVCSAHGSCVAENNCQCQAGWSGSECQNNEVVSCYGIANNIANVCNGNGACTAQDTCSCTVLYKGDQCELENDEVCFGVATDDQAVCSGHGLCIAKDKCQCDLQWSGVQCELNTWTCDELEHDDPFVCTDGQGQCVAQDTCTCNAGFKGSVCQFPIIAGYQCGDHLSEEPTVCSGRGQCLSDDHCTCDTGYSGTECQSVVTCGGLTMFDPNVCSGNGICQSTGFCTCHIGFSGATCEVEN